jgi:hypothetical protein
MIYLALSQVPYMLCVIGSENYMKCLKESFVACIIQRWIFEKHSIAFQANDRKICRRGDKGES